VASPRFISRPSHGIRAASSLFLTSSSGRPFHRAVQMTSPQPSSIAIQRSLSSRRRAEMCRQYPGEQRQRSLERAIAIGHDLEADGAGRPKGRAKQLSPKAPHRVQDCHNVFGAKGLRNDGRVLEIVRQHRRGSASAEDQLDSAPDQYPRKKQTLLFCRACHQRERNRWTSGPVGQRRQTGRRRRGRPSRGPGGVLQVHCISASSSTIKAVETCPSRAANGSRRSGAAAPSIEANEAKS
jgi:hypothetical protein